MLKTRRDGWRSCCLLASLVLGCTILSPIMLLFGISTIARELSLNDHGEIILADVEDSKTWSDSGNIRYQVKYRFQTEAGGGEYSCGDVTGRRDLWCTISLEGWRQLRETKQVEVRFLPENPWINQLTLADVPSPMPEAIIGILFGLAPWGFLLYVRAVSKNGSPVLFRPR
jgi:hypothetical protein